MIALPLFLMTGVIERLGTGATWGGWDRPRHGVSPSGAGQAWITSPSGPRPGRDAGMPGGPVSRPTGWASESLMLRVRATATVTVVLALAIIECGQANLASTLWEGLRRRPLSPSSS